MIYDLVICVIGLVLLAFGGDFLVRGAVAFASRLGVPALIVSLTVVAFGTSAPELVVAIQSALDGVPELALGNVVGSNTANVLLVLGVPAVISGLAMNHEGSNKNVLIMLGVSVIFIALAFTGAFTPITGAILLVLLFAVIFWMYKEAQNSRAMRKELEEELGDTEIPTWQLAAFLIGGLIALPLGAHLLVDGASSIARQAGVSEAVIGLTLVAIGTSLPELATTVMAGLRRQADVAIGNVIGSNLFNLLAILGVASFFATVPVPAQFLSIDLWIMLGASILLAIFILRKIDLNRLWGGLFLLGYLGYILFLIA